MISKHWFYRCILAWLVMASPVWARTWTSSSGKEIEADFVDADEQTVTLRKSDGQELKFKIDLLCDPDQQLLRDILLRRSTKGTPPTASVKEPASKLILPPAKAKSEDPEKSPTTEKKLFGELTPVTSSGKGLNPLEKTAEKTTKPTEKEKPKGIKIVERKWTNLQGKTITGKFVKIKDGNVMIFVTNKQVPAPFDQLSLTDQQYVVEVLTSRGEKIDLPNANALVANNLPNANPVAAPGMIPMPVPGVSSVPGVGAETSTTQPAIPAELLKAYGGLKLRDGTPITAAMIAELTPDQQNNLRSYLSYPEQGREEMAQIVIGAAIELRNRANGNPSPQPSTAATVVQPGMAPNMAPPGTTAENMRPASGISKPGKMSIPSVNALNALANGTAETTPSAAPTPSPSMPSQVAASPTPRVNAHTTSGLASLPPRNNSPPQVSQPMPMGADQFLKIGQNPQHQDQAEDVGNVRELILAIIGFVGSVAAAIYKYSQRNEE